MAGCRTALAVIVALSLGSTAWAHAIRADCRIRDDKVEVHAFFDDDTLATQAHVKVIDTDKKTVAEGKTDAKGTWSFPVPKAGEYQVIVDAGAGHRVTQKITIRTAPQKNNPQDKPAPKAVETSPASYAEGNGGEDRPSPSADPVQTASKQPGPGDFSGAIIESEEDAARSMNRWLKMAIGVAFIGVLGGAYLLARRAGGTSPKTPG